MALPIVVNLKTLRKVADTKVKSMALIYRGIKISHFFKNKKVNEIAFVIQEIFSSQGFSAVISDGKIEFLKTENVSSTKGVIELQKKKDGTEIKGVIRGHISYIAGFVILILFLLVISLPLAIILLVVVEYIANERAKKEMTVLQQSLFKKFPKK